MGQAKLWLRQWGQKARPPDSALGDCQSLSTLVLSVELPALFHLSNASPLFQDCASEDVEPFLESINTGAFCGHVLAPHSSVCLQLLILLGPVL